MRKIGIASDSTCDLSVELKERYEIAVLPLLVHLDEEEYQDGKDISLDEIFAWSDAHKKTPKTAAFAPAQVEAFLKEQMEKYEELIFF
ncbi:MAG: DegV family protein, partial [Lachnospiraceae bacterium]|nr:DegV family protein [Lachnospiraceae bacterium]